MLTACGFNFSVLTKPTDEEWPQNTDSEQIAGYLANKKALAFDNEADKNVILTADTIVVNDHQVLNKPANPVQAEVMLLALSGKSHFVYTSFCLRYKQFIGTYTAKAEVMFNNLSPEIINHYITIAKPFDKAGGYGIQDWIGMVGINHINGSFYTVMGLPTNLVYQELTNLYKKIEEGL